jgi:hypothetical protein
MTDNPEIPKYDDLLCEYCGLPISASLVLTNVKIGLGVTLPNRPVHPQCLGHFRAEKQAMLIARVSLFNGLLALLLSIVALLIAVLK